MKHKALLLVPVFGGFLLAVLFVFLLGQAAIPADPSRANSFALDDAVSGSLIAARRTISDPGINSPLSLAAGGGQVAVTGHATCPKGGQSVRIMVQVTQGGTGPKAIGSTEDPCAGGNQNWTATGAIPGSGKFTPGPADVCALAIFFDRGDGGAVTRRWCKAVTLQ